MTELLVRPKLLADALHNAFVAGKEKLDSKRIEHVLLAFDRESVLVYGGGAYLASRTRVPAEGEVDAFLEVSILRDEANTLQSRLRKCSGAQAARVAISMYEEPEITQLDNDTVWAHLTIHDGGEAISALPEADPDGKSTGYFEWVDGKLDMGLKPVEQPIMFNMETLSRLKDIKASGGNIDVLAVNTPGIMRVKVGPEFDGLIACVDVDKYKTEHGDHLLLKGLES